MQNVFDQTELLRYQRHFPVIGIDGQKKLKHAKILCVGAGGLGCPALQYLAAAGVGVLGIMDGDKVEISNLQRQILFTDADVGRNKATIIAERLREQNPYVFVQIHPEFLSDKNAKETLSHYDLILDATDNYESRYLLNATCRELKKPLISASIYQFDMQISVFNYKNGPCYQCLYPEPPPAYMTPNCAMGGVLGVLPGVAGTIQATEAMKIILEMGEVLSGTLLSVDLLDMRFNRYEITKQDCLHHPEVNFHKQQCINTSENVMKTISASELSLLLANKEHPIQLIDVRQPHEREICHIGGQHIPLPEFENNLHQLAKGMPTVVYCKSGARSATACRILLEAGFKDVSNLEGGILGWIEDVDNKLMRY